MRSDKEMAMHLRILVFPVLALAAVPATVLSAPHDGAGAHLVIAPPWLRAADIVRGPGRSDSVARVRAAGAVALDPGVLLSLCGAD